MDNKNNYNIDMHIIDNDVFIKLDPVDLIEQEKKKQKVIEYIRLRSFFSVCERYLWLQSFVFLEIFLICISVFFLIIPFISTTTGIVYVFKY